MIQMIVRLGKWLETRFPEKLVVKAEDYLSLKTKVGYLETELSMARSALADSLKQIDIMVQRVGVLETAAVHKGAVQDLVTVVKSIKDEIATLKTNLGFGNPALAKIEAYFGGEPVPPEDTTNG